MQRRELRLRLRLVRGVGVVRCGAAGDPVGLGGGEHLVDARRGPGPGGTPPGTAAAAGRRAPRPPSARSAPGTPGRSAGSPRRRCAPGATGRRPRRRGTARSAATVALASLRGDHRTTTTGCCVELCTRSGNVVWSMSTTYAPGEGSPPGVPGRRRRRTVQRGEVDRSPHVEAGTGSGGLRHAAFFLRGLGQGRRVCGAVRVRSLGGRRGDGVLRGEQLHECARSRRGART